MNTLEQFNLLEQKIESAVKKIQQLQAENDALRNKCAELTNALSAKSEQLSGFENDKNIIVKGIQKALNCLDSISQNDAQQVANEVKESEPVQSLSFSTQQQAVSPQINETVSVQTGATTQEDHSTPPVLQFENHTFNSMNEVEQEVNEPYVQEDDADENQNSDFGFDIF